MKDKVPARVVAAFAAGMPDKRHMVDRTMAGIVASSTPGTVIVRSPTTSRSADTVNAYVALDNRASFGYRVGRVKRISFIEI